MSKRAESRPNADGVIVNTKPVGCVTLIRREILRCSALCRMSRLNRLIFRVPKGVKKISLRRCSSTTG